MNRDFDLDLKFGEEGEQWLTLLADERKIEVKRDNMWHQTCNLFIEFKYKGHPSGIAVTKSDYFAYILTLEGKQVGVFIWAVAPLKMALKRMYEAGRIRMIKGGDGNQSQGFLIPMHCIGDLTLLCKPTQSEP